ncbi:Fic family protein [Neiella sp. HB171785]|uniref:protein adenylyltransferase n=1 Tax=Neiella litorisoli TaxID=2771431 RepID=A0A8J6QNA9_9GAMM|nr:Fic family protein [Neiella litorisoli]MBD1387831.1 Fic family protein [Neiella litorisoli]
MPDKYGVEQDHYCYQGSDVLINLLNITDPTELSEAEAAFSLARYEAYESQGLALEDFDLAHLQKLHHHLFQDLYTWAGNIRTVDISKGETRFCNCQLIEKNASKLLSQIPLLVNLTSTSEQIKLLAELFCELNVIHPFREGNGRAQRFFFEELAFTLGLSVIWPDISKEKWVEANVHGFYGNLKPLENIFSEAISELD